MTAAAGHCGWLVVVPVKRLLDAKSRLALPPLMRPRVARAMALDTVSAAVGCPLVAQVWVVTDDEALAARPGEFGALGALLVPDAPRAGLNAAIRHGANVAWRSLGPMDGAAAGVVALTADLPALQPAELAAVLGEVPGGARAVVADAGAVGTTLLAATDYPLLQPAFGPDSYRRHVDGGAVDLTTAGGPGLRRDVDTLADLQSARSVHLGRYTRELMIEVEPWLPHPGSGLP